MPHMCRDSLLLKAVSGDKGLKLEVMDPKEEQREVKQEDNEGKDWVRWARGSGTRVRGFKRLQVVGVDKRTVWGLFAQFHRSYILIQGGLCVV